jgi:hypothetical protein
MRTTSFQTRNHQTVEVFVVNHGKHFELWVVGPKENQRVILSHYLTHDDLERRLRYTKSILLNWTLAKMSDLPGAKSPLALQDEKSIECGTLWDSEALSDHLASVVNLDLDCETLAAARADMVGLWSDGISTLNLGKDGSLSVSISPDSAQPFLRALVRIQADEWRLSDSWQLRVVNRQSLKVERRLVHRVSATELQLGDEGNCIAFVLKRV